MAIIGTGYKEYSKSVDYSNISNLQQLREARVEISNKVEKKEIELKYQIRVFKEMLNPMTYVNYAVAKLASVENIVKSACKGYKVARDFFANYRQNKDNSNMADSDDEYQEDSNTQQE